MKIDKTTIGLSIVLAALVALAVFSASLPAMATHQAEQNATVSQATTLEIMNQTGVVPVTHWNFTASVGTNSTNVTNSGTDDVLQNAADSDKPVARIKNPDTNPNLIIYLNASAFIGTANVTKEWYNITATTENTTDADGINKALTWSTDTNTQVQINANTFKNLWLKIYATKSGTSTSTFKVLGEAE